MGMPQILTDFNTAVDGLGFAGVANKITIPEIVFKTIEKDLAGKAGAYEILTGRVEKMEAEIEFNSFSAESIFAMLGTAGGSDVPLIFRGSVKDGSDDIAVKLLMQGVWKSLKISDFEVASEVANAFKVSLQKFALYVDGVEKVYININTWEIRTGGLDISSQIRSNLGL